MATVSSYRIPTNLPIFDSKNYDKWAKQMRVLFGYQEVLEIVISGVTQLGAEATDIQRATYKEEKKKDYKSLFLIHSCVDNDNLEKVGDCDSAKQAWEILEKSYVRCRQSEGCKVTNLQVKVRVNTNGRQRNDQRLYYAHYPVS